MTTEEVTQKLTQIFHDVFGDDTIEIRREMTATDLQGWDSLTHLRLVLSIERGFGIRLPSTKVAALKNVGDMLDLIEACKKN